MKSRILSCFLIFALCFSMLSACGSDTAPSDHSPSSSLHTEISDSQDSGTLRNVCIERNGKNASSLENGN